MKKGMYYMGRVLLGVVFTALMGAGNCYAAPETKGVTLSVGQREIAGIQIGELIPQLLNYQIYAPAEVLANGYRSFVVSPRVDSVVLRRYAGLGDQVEAGEPLVTLFSEVVAEAQAALWVAAAEWRRVQELGITAVGEQRYVDAQANFELSRGRLLAFGLSSAAVDATLQKISAIGEYSLVALEDGIITSDDFRQGQRVVAGYPLMEVADEDELWVEARLSPHNIMAVPKGTEAEVLVAGERLPAIVTQEAFTIDEQTRTRVVRLRVENKAHRLHPGMFAEVYFSFCTKEPVLAVRESALMRGADGDWLVYVQDGPDHFVARKVKIGRSLDGWREIEGVAAGSLLVMEGAFFVASEQNKSGFASDGH